MTEFRIENNFLEMGALERREKEVGDSMVWMWTGADPHLVAPKSLSGVIEAEVPRTLSRI